MNKNKMLVKIFVWPKIFVSRIFCLGRKKNWAKKNRNGKKFGARKKIVKKNVGAEKKMLAEKNGGPNFFWYGSLHTKNNIVYRKSAS